jgi:2-polyprenyl-6-methoxyphenol hydroxylase-like FAD-dependent oxidoreductase
MSSEATDLLEPAAVIAGGGPAGAMLGLLLARAGVPVLVLEKHADFLRDFRGDTIHASTLRLLDEVGLGAEFSALPHQEVRRLFARTDEGEFPLADFGWLPGPHKCIAFLPQWDFLDFVTSRAARLPHFTLRMRAQVTGLLRDGDRVVGLTYRDDTGVIHEVRAALTIAADGRQSTLRAASGLPSRTFGAPMDVLWFRLPQRADKPGTFARLGRGRLLIQINRGDYWQIAYVIPKGGYDAVRAAGLPAFRTTIAELEPAFADRVDELTRWESVQVLSVVVDRLRKWWLPGFLCIGDAAHAMSPIAGVGINLAIQDAVATANLVTRPLLAGTLAIDQLAAVQARRQLPTILTQAAQRAIQNRIVTAMLRGDRRGSTPLALRLLQLMPPLQALPAYAIGVGVRPEHVRTGGPARGGR